MGFILNPYAYGAAPAWTPAELSPLAWYSASDESSLFQDSSGATAISAYGNPVGKWLDLSGNGRHMSQSTSTKRPLWQETNGHASVVPDGVDDILSAASSGTKSTLYVAAAIRFLNTASDPYGRLIGVSTNDSSADASGTYDTAALVLRNGSTATSYRGGSFRAATGSITSGTDVVVEMISAADGADAATNGGSFTSSAYTASASMTLAHIRLFGNFGSDGLSNWPLYELVLLDYEPDSTQRAALVAYLKSKGGIA